MRFDEFISEKQALVISYDTDLYLEDCGFDFRIGRSGLGNREYYKLIEHNGEIIEVVFDSCGHIYISKDKHRRVCIEPYVREKMGDFSISEFIKTEYFVDIFEEMLDRLTHGEL